MEQTHTHTHSTHYLFSLYVSLLYIYSTDHLVWVCSRSDFTLHWASMSLHVNMASFVCLCFHERGRYLSSQSPRVLFSGHFSHPAVLWYKARLTSQSHYDSDSNVVHILSISVCVCVCVVYVMCVCGSGKPIPLRVTMDNYIFRQWAKAGLTDWRVRLAPLVSKLMLPPGERVNILTAFYIITCCYDQLKAGTCITVVYQITWAWLDTGQSSEVQSNAAQWLSCCWLCRLYLWRQSSSFRSSYNDWNRQLLRLCH